MSTASSTRSGEASGPPVLVLVGPTASGKTALLEELFGEGRKGFPGPGGAEVVSADSMQAYRGMDLGTAKPDAALRARLPHHLIDIKDPSEGYSAGEFLRRADEACARVRAAGKLPVVSGGTGFYVRAFLLGLPPAPPSDPAIRAELARELAEGGAAALRAELEAADPPSAARIHPNDSYRLTRALEVIRGSGRPLSDFVPPRGPRAAWSVLLVELRRPRRELHARIEARVDAMFAAGLPAEFEALRASGLGEDAPGMQAIGYREFFEAEALGTGVEGARALIKRNTRRYAKRQETFFSGLPGLVGLEAGEGMPDPAPRLAALLADFLEGRP